MRRWFMTRTAGWDPCAGLQNLPGSQSIAFFSSFFFFFRQDSNKERKTASCPASYWNKDFSVGAGENAVMPKTQRDINQTERGKAEISDYCFSRAYRLY